MLSFLLLSLLFVIVMLGLDFGHVVCGGLLCLHFGQFEAGAWFPSR